MNTNKRNMIVLTLSIILLLSGFSAIFYGIILDVNSNGLNGINEDLSKVDTISSRTLELLDENYQLTKSSKITTTVGNNTKFLNDYKSMKTYRINEEPVSNDVVTKELKAYNDRLDIISSENNAKQQKINETRKLGYIIIASAFIVLLFNKTEKAKNNPKIKVDVINKGDCKLPEYATIGSAGIDLQANIKEPIELNPFCRILIPTGLFISIPKGYEAQIRGRSGLAIKHGITLANGVGTIDSDYRGELKIILSNVSNEVFTINPKERVAQLVLAKIEQLEFNEVDSLDNTSRSDGGFGHTGKHWIQKN